MSLYQKGLLSFAIVILIAVATVAVLVGQRTATELRQYTTLYSNRAQLTAQALAEYYTTRTSWEGLQDNLDTLALPGFHGGTNSGGQGRGAGQPTWEFRVADVQGHVVANTIGPVGARVSKAILQRALPIEVEQVTVGYLIPDDELVRNAPLDEPAQRLLERIWSALLLGSLIAFMAALLLAGLLERGIVAPVRELTDAAQEVAGGDLSVHAPVRGDDEIAHLAQAFNHMAAGLKRAEDARRAQTADIAHELRNPLAVLQGTLEALADGVYDPTPDNIQPALDQVRTLNRLVTDLRTLALADAGALRLERHTLNLASLISHIVDIYRAPLAEKELHLHVEVEAPLPQVSADADRITQVLDNILSNAIRYVPAGSTVRISAAKEQGGVTVRVADNGPGVPETDLPKLFERFWRGDPSRSRATGGSGLGLAIARRVIEAHEGRIWAETTPGGGLTMAFWLLSQN